ncbi:ATP-binding protein [Lysobacter terrae]
MWRFAPCRSWFLALLSGGILAASHGLANAAPPSATTPTPAPAPAAIRLVENESPLFETLDRARGLMNPTTNDIRVDRHGFVWIANTDGLHRFDGRNLYSIERDAHRPDSLASTSVSRLAETPDALWLAFDDATIQRLSMVTGRLTVVPIAVAGVGAPKAVTWFRGDAYGRVWVGTDLGLLRYDPATGQTLLTTTRKLLRINMSPGGRRVFVITDDFQIGMMEASTPGSLRFVARLPVPDTAGSTPILIPDDKGVWFALWDKALLWRLDFASSTLRRIDSPVAPVSSMAAERNGTLWIGTLEGLYRLDPTRGELHRYRYRSGDPLGLNVKVIRVMRISPDGDLWIGGSFGGVSRVRLRSGVARMELGKLPDAICGLYENARRQLFVTSCEGGMGRLDLATGQLSDLSRQFDRLNLTSRRFFRRPIGDGADGFWLGVTEGLVHWRPGANPTLIPFDHWANRTTRDSRGRVWVCHQDGLAVLLPGSHALREATAYKEGKPFSFGYTFDVEPGPDGTLWVAGTNGLFQYWPDSGQVRQFVSERGNPQSLSDTTTTNVYTDPAGRVWVMTNSGLDRMIVGRDGAVHFRRYDRADGLPDAGVASMVSDRTGALWVTTVRGIARWDPRRDRFQPYLPVDGVPDISYSSAEAALLGSDGKLYFGTDDGLWRVDPDLLQVARPHSTVLSAYQVGESTIINLRGRDLPGIQAQYLDRRLTFTFATLGDPRNLFYRLAGLDDHWQSMPANLTIGYHQLPPGDYRLEVSRLDEAEHRTTELSLPVGIAPPIWRTPWAYFGYLLAIAAALGWVVRSYIVRRRRRREYVRLLRAKDERLSLAMAASGDVMFEIDFQKNQVTETGGEEASRHSSESHSIPAYLDLIHPDDIEPVRHYFEALQQEHTPDLQVECRRRSAANGWRWVRLRGQFIAQDTAEAPDRFTGMLHDITQERADQEMRHKTEQLRMQAEVRGQFLAVISHEIRTPLNGVVGMIELLDATSLNDEQRKMLAACRDSAFILLSIVNDFLDLSKIEAGKLELERTEVPVRDLLEAAASSLRLQAVDRGLRLDLYVTADVPVCIVGDWVRLRQILTNLLSNAIKFTERGGVELAAHMEGAGELRFTVTDTGMGMDEETVRNLFQPFQQASAATARRFGGSGLGLSIVKHLAEVMGGRVECRSRAGEGTCITVALPVQAGVAPRAEGLYLQGLRALAIVAPERSKYLREPLRWLGAQVEFVGSVDAALLRIRSAQEPRIDVVLLEPQETDADDLPSLYERLSATRVPLVAVATEPVLPPESQTPVVFVDGNPLTSQALVGGVELALGRKTARAAIPPARVEAAPPAASRVEVPSHARILLAEDNPINREVFARQLDRLGYACDIAEDGEEAWALLQHHPGRYGLLLTDAQMPRLDGYQLAARIREHELPGGPRLKILMITAGVLAGERDRCLALGMDGFLPKPLSLDALNDKLTELLPSPAAIPAPAVAASQSPSASAGLTQLLELLQGNQDHLRRILEVFIHTTRTDMQALEDAVRSGDRHHAGEMAHRLKSACSQLGEQEAGQALEEIEKAALSMRIDDAAFEGLVLAAKREVALAQARVEQYLMAGSEQ